MSIRGGGATGHPVSAPFPRQASSTAVGRGTWGDTPPPPRGFILRVPVGGRLQGALYPPPPRAKLPSAPHKKSFQGVMWGGGAAGPAVPAYVSVSTELRMFRVVPGVPPPLRIHFEGVRGEGCRVVCNPPPSFPRQAASFASGFGPLGAPSPRIHFEGVKWGGGCRAPVSAPSPAVSAGAEPRVFRVVPEVPPWEFIFEGRRGGGGL